MWLLLFVPGPPEHADKGIMLGFWMGKDSKDHPLGDRGSTGGPGFAESGARNWVHSAATVLAFLQKERGLLQAGHRFTPIFRDDALRELDATPAQSAKAVIAASNVDEPAGATRAVDASAADARSAGRE